MIQRNNLLTYISMCLDVSLVKYDWVVVIVKCYETKGIITLIKMVDHGITYINFENLNSTRQVWWPNWRY